ncbi:hypothetical protein MASR2M15_12460 [Anaerolineales bacterium]
MSKPVLIETQTARLGRHTRNLRAIWHDSMALIQEFRHPLLVSLVTMFAGGWLYGQLLIVAGYEPLPYFELPYLMLSLMLLETPTEIPTQWYLLLFWYILPLIALYIVGKGAVDFIRLFINRDGRQNAWETALASTFRNHIIVIGMGHIGLRTAKLLVELGFEIVIIDLNISPDFKNDFKAMDAPTIMGDGRQIDVLRQAGIEHARSIIICTSDDHTNLEITMRVRDLRKDIKIVTRMWDDGFAKQLKSFMNAEVQSASNLAAPAFAGSAVGIEIAQTIRIGQQDFSMIRMTVQENSFMEGKSIDELQDDEDIDIVLHGLDPDHLVVHPDGDKIVKAGEMLVLFARHNKITEIVSRNYPLLKKP